MIKIEIKENERKLEVTMNKLPMVPKLSDILLGRKNELEIIRK